MRLHDDLTKQPTLTLRTLAHDPLFAPSASAVARVLDKAIHPVQHGHVIST
jgi:hypothetical protein